MSETIREFFARQYCRRQYSAGECLDGWQKYPEDSAERAAYLDESQKIGLAEMYADETQGPFEYGEPNYETANIDFSDPKPF